MYEHFVNAYTTFLKEDNGGEYLNYKEKIIRKQFKCPSVGDRKKLGNITPWNIRKQLRRMSSVFSADLSDFQQPN